MASIKLPFGKINILREDLAEIVIDDDVEVSLDAVQHAEAVLVDHMQAPFSLLFDKRHDYSFNFQAQRAMGVFPELNAIAVVCYRSSSKLAIDALAKMRRSKPWKLKIFEEKSDALEWLRAEQDKARSASTYHVEPEHS